MKYTAEFYRGRTIGNNGFLSRVGYQVVATDETTNKRRYVFSHGHKTKSPCLKSPWVASHYCTGPNKHDQGRLNSYREWAEKNAAFLNKEQPYK